MRTPNQTRKRNLSILWKHLIMMLSILLLAVAVLVVIYNVSLRTLTQENLSKTQRTLERNCLQLENEMMMTSALPSSIDRSEYYMYLKTEHTDVLDRKYYPLLSLLRNDLNNQLYLRGSSDATILFLSNVNSIISTQAVCWTAEDCFAKCFVYSQTGSEVLMGYLRQKNSQIIVPMQPVSVSGHAGEQYLSFIIHTPEQNIGVMSLYSEKTVLNALGLPDLPEGTYVLISAADAQILMQYPDAVTQEVAQTCYPLFVETEKVPMKVQLWIPKQYFRDLLRPLRTIGLSMILFVILAGVALSFLLSLESVKPIRKLISVHGGETEPGNNDEIQRLDRILRSASERSQELQDKLTRQVLARILSGGTPSVSDEEQLAQSELLPASYRAAIVHTSEGCNDGLGARLKQQLPELIWVYLSKTETGLLLPDASADALTQIMENAGEALSCGISSPAAGPVSLPMAAHQARLVLPDRGAAVFRGQSRTGSSISWLQHERLYQGIFSGRESEAQAVLDCIVEQADYRNIYELYYNVRFVLRSAAEEMDIVLSEAPWRGPSADNLPQESVAELREMLRQLMEGIREKQNLQREEAQLDVLDYIAANASDCSLCASSVAREFGVYEKRIYDAVRQSAGMSFNEYLLSVRMKQAGRLLCNTQQDIAKIAELCGYQSSSTFYRAFKRYYSMAPGDFRRSGGVWPQKPESESATEGSES